MKVCNAWEASGVDEGRQERILCLPRTFAGPYVVYFLQGDDLAPRPVCRNALSRPDAR